MREPKALTDRDLRRYVEDLASPVESARHEAVRRLTAAGPAAVPSLADILWALGEYEDTLQQATAEPEKNVRPAKNRPHTKLDWRTLFFPAWLAISLLVALCDFGAPGFFAIVALLLFFIGVGRAIGSVTEFHQQQIAKANEEKRRMKTRANAAARLLKEVNDPAALQPLIAALRLNGHEVVMDRTIPQSIVATVIRILDSLDKSNADQLAERDRPWLYSILQIEHARRYKELICAVLRFTVRAEDASALSRIERLAAFPATSVNGIAVREAACEALSPLRAVVQRLEAQGLLLRASESKGNDSLLRASQLQPESDPALLLRSVDASESS